MFYPIFHPFPTGESRELCAEVSKNCHTFRVPRGLRGSHPGDIPSLSPEVCLPDTERSVRHDQVRRYRVAVYPGWYTGVYTGCTLPHHGIGDIYRSVHYPPCLPPGYIQGCTTHHASHTLVYTGCTLPTMPPIPGIYRVYHTYHALIPGFRRE